MYILKRMFKTNLQKPKVAHATTQFNSQREKTGDAYDPRHRTKSQTILFGSTEKKVAGIHGSRHCPILVEHVHFVYVDRKSTVSSESPITQNRNVNCALRWVAEEDFVPIHETQMETLPTLGMSAVDWLQAHM